ncbi:MAG: hypothetical protein R6W93_12450 [Candidatus Limnocylindrales bacterium]
MDSDGLDRLGRALMGAGGCLTVVVFPVVLLGFVLFGVMLAIGFGASSTSAEVDGLIFGAVGVFGAIALAVGVVWVLALRGRRWAQVLMVLVGLVLAVLASPFPQRLGPDYRRPEDIGFTLIQLAIALMPAALAVGALLRLLANRRNRRSDPAVPSR